MNTKNSYFILIILTVLLMVGGCDDIVPAPPKGEVGSFIDERDGTVYETIEIGAQTWMAENLSFKLDSGFGSWNLDSPNDSIYGYLYSWETANKAAPAGWHLPTIEEWEILIDYLGGQEVAGGRMKDSEYWEHPNTDGNNNSGFTARPAGYKNISNSEGEELLLGKERWGYWWSSTPDSSSYAWSVRLHNSEASAVLNDYDPEMGFSIRCVKDN